MHIGLGAVDGHGLGVAVVDPAHDDRVGTRIDGVFQILVEDPGGDDADRAEEMLEQDVVVGGDGGLQVRVPGGDRAVDVARIGIIQRDGGHHRTVVGPAQGHAHGQAEQGLLVELVAPVEAGQDVGVVVALADGGGVDPIAIGVVVDLEGVHVGAGLLHPDAILEF